MWVGERENISVLRERSRKKPRENSGKSEALWALAADCQVPRLEPSVEGSPGFPCHWGSGMDRAEEFED